VSGSGDNSFGFAFYMDGQYVFPNDNNVPYLSSQAEFAIFELNGIASGASLHYDLTDFTYHQVFTRSSGFTKALHLSLTHKLAFKTSSSMGL